MNSSKAKVTKDLQLPQDAKKEVKNVPIKDVKNVPNQNNGLLFPDDASWEAWACAQAKEVEDAYYQDKDSINIKSD